MITIENTPLGSIRGQIFAKCDKCPWVSVNRSNTLSGRSQLHAMGAAHVELEHTPPVLIDVNSLYPQEFLVSAEDFTESHHGAEEGITPEQAIELLSERIKELRSKADARDLDAAKKEIRALKTALKQRMNEAWEQSQTIINFQELDAELTNEIRYLVKERQENEVLIKDLRETIDELMRTPEPMPLCKNPEGHNYIPLDQMFVFCTRCGHSIHYKAKG